MAAASGRHINLSKKELNNIESALKDEKFVKLLADYAAELADPANKARYEAEIAALEAERGYEVAFVHPQPGYVIKAAEVGQPGSKLFINICSEAQIERPVSVTGTQDGQSGLRWSIPYSLSQPREDVDRNGSACKVYDVIFHPDTLYLAHKDPRIKGLVHSTAFDALTTSFNVKVESASVKFPKMKFKGVFRPTVIRKPLKEVPSPAAVKQIEDLKDLETVTPRHTIKYRSTSDLQDTVIQPNNVAVSSRPKEMVIEVDLPLLDSAAGIDLDVQEKSLSLVKNSLPRHRLDLALPLPVLEEEGSAKFDKSTSRLIITLPVKQGPVMKSERLSSNDSGIDCEEGYRTSRSSVASDDEGGNAAAVDCDRKFCETSEADAASESAAHGSDAASGALEKSEIINDYRTGCLAGFLDESVSYLFPNFTHMVQDGLMILTLEVKNVSPDSVQFKVIPDKLAVQIKFSSVGSGHFPIHYAFYLHFTAGSGGADAASGELADIETECWDNNVIFQIPLAKEMARFRVGLNPGDLREKLFRSEKLESSRTLSLKAGEEIGPKYTQEKHPKLMKQEKVKETGLTIPKEEKERHSSGESLDSSMSVSPYDQFSLEPKTEESEAEPEEEEPRFDRSSSSESTLRVRGILKRRKVELPGSRFRCYSESHAVDLVNVDATSRITSTQSDTRIAEGEEEEEGQTFKKSVRFSEKVQQQLYRINSSIVAKTAKNKKKAEKKRRAVERRLSEGDSVELKTPAKQQHLPLQTSHSLDSLSQECHEDSGLASSFEENMVIDPSSSSGSNPTTKPKNKKRTKKRTKTFEMSNDLIFDLDI